MPLQTAIQNILHTTASTWKPAPSPLNQPAPPRTGPEPLPRRYVARVFERLGAQLGARMADLYAGVPPALVQAEWAEGLAGFHQDELRRGIAACRSRVFAPTLGEFMRLCRPGLDPELAWLEAAAGLRARDAGQPGDWSHPAVFHAACACAVELRHETYPRCRKRWEWELARAFARPGEGADAAIPPPAPRLVHQPRTGPPPAVVRERLLRLLAQARQESARRPAAGTATTTTTTNTTTAATTTTDAGAPTA